MKEKVQCSTVVARRDLFRDIVSYRLDPFSECLIRTASEVLDDVLKLLS